MATSAKARKLDARLDVRLQQKNKDLIEEAAVLAGQSVSDFVVFTLVQRSGEVLEQHRNIRMSNRDRDRFLKILEFRMATFLLSSRTRAAIVFSVLNRKCG